MGILPVQQKVVPQQIYRTGDPCVLAGDSFIDRGSIDPWWKVLWKGGCPHIEKKTSGVSNRETSLGALNPKRKKRIQNNQHPSWDFPGWEDLQEIYMYSFQMFLAWMIWVKMSSSQPSMLPRMVFHRLVPLLPVTNGKSPRITRFAKIPILPPFLAEFRAIWNPGNERWGKPSCNNIRIWKKMR